MFRGQRFGRPRIAQSLSAAQSSGLPRLAAPWFSAAPQLSDWGRVAGHAVIFAAALASGSVDDSRLTFGSQQAQLYDQQATRAVFPSARTPPPITGQLPAIYVLVPEQLTPTIQPSIYSSPPAPLVAQRIPLFATVPEQLTPTLQPSVWQAVLAQGAVDDSRLHFGGNQYSLHDQSASRLVWSPSLTPATVFPNPILSIYAAPQLVDLTQQGSVWDPTPQLQGVVRPSILIAQQLYVDAPSFVRAPNAAAQGRVPPILWQPGQVDLTQQGWVRGTPPPRQGGVPPTTVQGQQLYVDVPSSVRSPIPAPQGRVPAPTLQPQQSYLDVWARVQAPNPAAQGRVPPTTVIGQQAYADIGPQLKSPQALPQGAVPALTQASQADPSQLPALIWSSATATLIIPNPAAPFWAVPAQDENRQYSALWPSLVSGQTPPVFAGVRAVQQADTSQLAAQVWSSARPLSTPVSPFWSVPGQVDLTQQPLVFRAAIASSTTAMPRQLWATPQFVDLQPFALTRSVFRAAALPAKFVSAAPQADPSINYSQVFVLRTFVTAGGQPFRAWVGIGRASSTAGEAGNVG